MHSNQPGIPQRGVCIRISICCCQGGSLCEHMRPLTAWRSRRSCVSVVCSNLESPHYFYLQYTLYWSGKNIKYEDPFEHTAVGIEPVEATFRKLECIVDMLIMSSVCRLQFSVIILDQQIVITLNENSPHFLRGSMALKSFSLGKYTVAPLIKSIKCSLQYGFQ